MADARTLLRQQQASRRLTSPHALYSSTGKLTCALCREPVKTEALWDAHARSPSHRAALQAAAAARARETPAAGTKRKHDDDGDESPEDDDDERRKRSRADGAVPPPALTPASSGSGSRASNTPSHGVELSIPSRPATPKTTGPPPSDAARKHAGTAAQPGGDVDEAEWAAFEADIAAATAPYAEDAVISAPAVPASGTGEQKEGEEEAGNKRGTKEVEIEAEREDAKRALEDEFDEMEELEARARRLKERREALRARASRADLKGADAAKEAGAKAEASRKGVDKENAKAEEEEESEEEEEEDDYAWGGLRFAGRV